MAEFVYATSHLAGNFTNPDNALGDTPSTWAGPTLNTNVSQTSRWAIGDPADPLTSAATQTIRVTARKGSNSGNPTIVLNLWENGVSVAFLANATITNTVGQVVTGTFNTADITNRNNVEIEVIMSGVPGGGSARNCAQISDIEWEADTTASTPIEEIGGSLDVEVDLGGALTVPPLEIGSSLDVEVGFAGVLDVPPETVDALTSSLDIEVDFGGTLDPLTLIPELTGSLDIETNLSGSLGLVPETLTSSLDIEADLSGSLGLVPETVIGSLNVAVDLTGALGLVPETLTSTLDVEVDLGGTLTVVGGIPALTSTLAIEAGFGGVLGLIPDQLASTLPFLVDFGGVFGGFSITHPQGRATAFVPLYALTAPASRNRATAEAGSNIATAEEI